MSRLRALCAVVVVAVGSLAAPAAQPGLFEWDSVEPRTSSPSGSYEVAIHPGARFTATNITVRELIRVAYGFRDPLEPAQVIGGPAWIDSDRFDIEAKAPDDLPRELYQSIPLQWFLAERFKLRGNREQTRPLPVYALVKGSGELGPNLWPAVNCRQVPQSAPGRGQPQKGNEPCGVDRTRRGRIAFGGISLSLVLEEYALRHEVQRRIFDRTGLTGYYSGSLEWTPSPSPRPDSPFAVPSPLPPPPGAPSFVDAVTQQWGLKLEASTAPVPVIVVLEVQRPAFGRKTEGK